MSKFKGRYRVETTRLPGWDYAGMGYYFVTLCTEDRLPFFGIVTDGQMILSPMGEIVAREWQRTEQVRDKVALDACVIMPNHVHGIVVIHGGDTAKTGHGNNVETPHRGVSTRRHVSTENPAPETNPTPSSRLAPGSLGAIMGQIKSICTKKIWATGRTDFGWQPRFYDRIIRDEETLRKARQYIVDNPSRWSRDRDNPANLYM